MLCYFQGKYKILYYDFESMIIDYYVIYLFIVLR